MLLSGIFSSGLVGVGRRLAPLVPAYAVALSAFTLAWFLAALIMAAPHG